MRWTLKPSVKPLAKLLAFTLFFASLSACGGKSAGDRDVAKVYPANMLIIYQPIDLVWKELIKILRYDYLYNIEISNRKARIFSTELIRDEDNWRFRLTGTLKFEGSGVVVVLYRQQQARVRGNVWQDRPSNFTLERAILQKLAQRLVHNAPSK